MYLGSGLKKIALYFFLVLALRLTCQVSNSIYEISDPDTVSKDYTKIRLFLTGEFHYQPGNLNLMLSYWEHLNKNNIYPMYIIEEQGPSVGYTLNKYLETGDEYLLDLLESYEASKPLYRALFKYRNELPENKKFYFVGVDIEQYYYITEYAIRNILIKEPYENTDSLPYEVRYVYSLLKQINRPDITSTKLLKKLIKKTSDIMKTKDSTIILNWAGKEWEKLKEIIASFELSSKRKHLLINNESAKFFKEREDFMLNNVYRLYKKDSTTTAYGHFGIYHIQLSPETKTKKEIKSCFASLLNSNPKYYILNGRISSNSIFYGYIKFKHYKFLGASETEVKNQLSKMPNNSLALFELRNRPKYSSLLLFKRDKVK